MLLRHSSYNLRHQSELERTTYSESRKSDINSFCNGSKRPKMQGVDHGFMLSFRFTFHKTAKNAVIGQAGKGSKGGRNGIRQGQGGRGI